MNRRALLKALPAAVVAGAVPAVAEESPILSTYREIIRLRDACCVAETDTEAGALCDQLFVLANDIVKIPARDLGEMMLKFLGHTVGGDHETGECPSSEQLWAEARALVGSAA